MIHRSVRRTSAFTLIELLIVVAIVMIIVSLLQPALQSAIMQARVAKCIGNLRGHGATIVSYATDHNGNLLPGSGHPDGDTLGAYPDSLNYLDQFVELTHEYGMPYESFVCPSYENSNDTSWFYYGSSYTDVADVTDQTTVSDGSIVGGFLITTGQHATRAGNPGGQNLYTHYNHLYNQKAGDFKDESPTRDSDGPEMILAADRTGRYNRSGVTFVEVAHTISEGITGHAQSDGNLVPAGGSRVYMDGSVKWADPDIMGVGDTGMVFPENAGNWIGDPRFQNGNTTLTW